MNDRDIRVCNFAVRASRRTILSIQELSIESGEFVAVLGPNGAGKSTLLRSCLGMQRSVAGQISILGHELARLNGPQITRLRRQIGYVPQLLPSRSEIPLTVREVVAIGRTGLAGLFRRLGHEDWRLVDEWMEKLGLAKLSDQGYGTISGGEQRKTLIARAMVQQPRLLLLDEPTANLDPGWRERMVETIHALHQLGDLTIVLVCHELEVLPACCRRVVLLEAGRITADGLPEAVLSDSTIESVYGPGLTVLHRAGRHAVVPARMAHA